MHQGFSAFPLTPVTDDGVDEEAFAGIVDRLVTAGVDSLGVLGSTGSYAYLDRDERARVIEVAVAHSGDVPVVVGVGAPGTRQVLRHVEDATRWGADAVLLPPVTYQPITDDEVYGLYADVTAASELPVVVYDNPGTTHVTFGDELHARIAALPGIASIKIPPVDPDLAAARLRVERLRALLPDDVSVGISGDAVGAVGLLAGCDTWYSSLGGTIPGPLLAITRAAQRDDAEGALAASAALDPLWRAVGHHGSYRTAAVIAEHLGLAEAPCLPRPLRPLPEADREAIIAALPTDLV
ncbi:MAG TPA: dihydrodipicolinate synthase family protein [Candidatus Janibacter merdipullorum]|nr:dihydrodipicolinate synthase family protein [Candidatus Janibacter merdipullorum]